MVFLVIAKDSELMVAAFEWLSCVCLPAIGFSREGSKEAQIKVVSLGRGRQSTW